MDNIKKTHGGAFIFPSMTILYVDPYSFHTVKISAIENFIKTTYCELLFNLFTSDFNRNKVDSGIKEVLGGDYKIKDTNELLEHIVGRLKIGKMKHFLSYPFIRLQILRIYGIFAYI